MTPKQVKFCDEYLIDCNATQAAIRAGYSEKTAYSIGDENLKKPEIAHFIKNRLGKAQIRNEVTLDDLVKELDENRKYAIEASTPQSAAATAATMAKAKLLGFVVDKVKSEITHKLSDSSDEHLEAIINSEH